MKRLSWKIAAIVVLALVLGYYDLPDSWQIIPYTPDFVKNSKVHLGLDLQGGTQLDYRIDLSKVESKDQPQIIEGVREVINRRVNGIGVSEPNIFISDIANEKHIVVELAGIKDIEEAKRIVGKTIQLEFKEQRDENEKENLTDIRKRANRIFKDVKAKPKDFAVIARQEEQATPGKAKFSTQDYTDIEGTPDENLKKTLKSLQVDGIAALTQQEISMGYLVNSSGSFSESKGYVLAHLLDRKTEEKEEKIGKTVEASHILIAYSGASRAGSEVTRTKGEAKKFAEELLGKIQKGEITFEDAAKQYSNEPGAKDSAGKLPEPVKEGGIYVKDFTDAALAIAENGALSAVTETKFGFHIIRADEITAERTDKKTITNVKYEYVVFSTLPDPWKETKLTGLYFKRAQVEFTQLGVAEVGIEFDEEGGKLFEEITEKNDGKPLAIFVGGDLISAPRVNGKITGGKAVITGNFSAKEAQDLARDLNTGAIPAPVVLTGQYSIGASLGQEALQKSVKAGIIGIIALALFMIFYYRLPGLLANLALSVYSILFLFLIKSELPLPIALLFAVVVFIAIVRKILNSDEGAWEKLISFMLACFILFFVAFLLATPVVLTLAGVAGVILSIGMAVDANVLIFERLKEELRGGRPLSSAIEVGFDRAWSSIRDSNFSSLITCAILYYFGTSIIKGFALTLAAGIIISMFTAISITRTFLLATVTTRMANNLWFFGLPKVKKELSRFDFIGRSKIWFVFSGVIITAGVISLIFNGLHLGMDFTGGTLMDVKFAKTATVEEIKTALPSEVAVGASVVSEGENNYLIRMRHIDSATHDEILNNFKQKFESVEETRYSTMGPVIGETLKNRAVLALLLALAAIVLYIAFAFRKVPKQVNPWKMGISALIALFHDVIIPVGIFSLLKVELDAFFITALLTIIGFSIHDTIVVFDRIRENLRTQGSSFEFAHIANQSMNQTLARSINTSLTTIITLLALMFFGSASIFHFVLALIIGIFVGTYSSIFIASPILVLWKKK